MNNKILVLLYTCFLFFTTQAYPMLETRIYEGADTVLLSGGPFLFYKTIPGELIELTWGDYKIDKVYCDTIPIAPIGPPHFKAYNNDAIYLRQGCGTCCFFAYLLLLNEGVIKTYMYPLAIDMKASRIAYTNSDDPHTLLIEVENFVTGEQQKIKESIMPRGCPIDGIENVEFLGNSLFIRWLNRENKTIEKLFPLTTSITQ